MRSLKQNLSALWPLGAEGADGAKSGWGPPVVAEAFQSTDVLNFCCSGCSSATSVFDHVSDVGGNFRRSSTSSRDGTNC